MCKTSHVATNLAIDDDLVVEAQKIGGHRTKKDAVTQALKEYIQRRRQLEVFELVGQIEYHDDYDYKSLRRKR
jgi:Arc/MetJ family transcription regulator